MSPTHKKSDPILCWQQYFRHKLPIGLQNADTVDTALWLQKNLHTRCKTQAEKNNWQKQMLPTAEIRF